MDIIKKNLKTKHGLIIVGSWISRRSRARSVFPAHPRPAAILIFRTKLRTLARPHHRACPDNTSPVHVNGCTAGTFNPVRSLTASQNLLAKEDSETTWKWNMLHSGDEPHSSFRVSRCRRHNSALVGKNPLI